MHVNKDIYIYFLLFIMTLFFEFVARNTCKLSSHHLFPPQVHSMYRRTGASFHKAQQEFSQGVFTSKTFQTAASTAASTAAQGAFQANN